MRKHLWMQLNQQEGGSSMGMTHLPHNTPSRSHFPSRAGEDQQVGPRHLLAVLLLDRPQQPAGLVEVRVVGPAVERGEALAAVTGTAAAVLDAVGPRRVPA